MSEVSYVLDSSAVLCVIFDEPGSEAVKQKLGGALISAVNLSEVIAKLQDRGMPGGDIDRIFAEFRFNISDFDEPAARLAGNMRNATRAHGLSLGDRACLALAAARGATAITADQSWENLTGIAPVLLVR